MYVQAHSAAGLVVAGTDAGSCMLVSADGGHVHWLAETPSQINAVAAVPGADVSSVVTAHQDGSLRLLDARRHESSAELACVRVAEDALTCVATDGCCAIAGSSSGALVVWNLDPSSDVAGAADVEGIASSGAGTAHCCALEGRDGQEIAALAVRHVAGAGWRLAAGHMGGCISVCAFDPG